MTIGKQLFFDLDGTLCDSFEGIQNGLQHALQSNELPLLSDETLRNMIGIPLRQSVRQFVLHSEEEDDPRYEAIIASFRRYYAEKGVFQSRPYDNIRELLGELSQRHELYVATAKPTSLAHEMLKFHDLHSFFSGIGGFEKDTTFSKSEVIRQFRKDAPGIMVGDKSDDILAGKMEGLTTVGVLYGYGTEGELENALPDFIVDNVDELSMLL